MTTPPPAGRIARSARPGTTIAGTALALLLAITACSAGTKAAHPPVSAHNGSGSSEPAGPARPLSSIQWQECQSGLQCATLKVPVDYTKPDGAHLTLALVKVPARDQAHRIGPLLVNPGGPGASGIELAVGNSWPAAIRDRFDIIGFDPRGVGQSSKVTCGIPIEQLYAADPIPQTPEQVQHLIDVSKAYVDDCGQKYANLLPYLGTRDVARDMDSIRVALGVPKISYVGYSYGTSIGQVYADMFPTHVRAMVLDGVVDIAEPGLQAAQQQGISFEKELDQFAKWCGSQSDCPLRPDPMAVVSRVQARTQQQPIPAPQADRPLGPGEFQLGVIQPLYSETLWPSLARALSAADRGDGSQLVGLADQYLSTGGFEIYFAVSCLDSTWPTGNPQAVIDAGRAIAPQAPHLGEATVTDYIRCALWPTPPQPLTAPKAIGSPPILVVSTTRDPATPYASGVQLARELPHGVLLTHDGDGHTIYAQGDSCVDDKVDHYLITLQPPKNGTVCG